MEGVGVVDTYAPVVCWITVRLLFVMFLVLKLDTQQVDYNNAFCQAPLDQNVYVELSHGFEVPNIVLPLRQSAYGLRKSPLDFYKHLREGLEYRDFIKSSYDDCLFKNGTFIILFWVDGCILYAKNKQAIDKVIDSLKDGYLLEKEEDVAGFLGIQVNRDGKGTIKLTQTGLIDKILNSMDMQDSNPKYTPADKEPLDKDLLNAPCAEDWNYMSIVGMLL